MFGHFRFNAVQTMVTGTYERVASSSSSCDPAPNGYSVGSVVGPDDTQVGFSFCGLQPVAVDLDVWVIRWIGLF